MSWDVHCPNCGGETELNGSGGAICFFCGRTFRIEEAT